MKKEDRIFEIIRATKFHDAVDSSYDDYKEEHIAFAKSFEKACQHILNKLCKGAILEISNSEDGLIYHYRMLPKNTQYGTEYEEYMIVSHVVL